MGMQEIKDNLIEEKSKIATPDDRYHTLFERINAAAFLTSFEGQIQEANQKSCEFLGYDWNELLRLTLQDILSKELDWKQCRDELAARGCLTFESETICKNGNHFPVDVNISIFRMNGTLVMFVLLWDITERKNQEKRIKASEKKYHGLFEYTTDGIFVLDTRGDILDINTRMCEILDVMKSSVLNKNLFNMNLLTATSLPVVIQQFEQLLSEKISASYTTEIKNRQGKVLAVEISSFFLVKKDNEVDNFVLIVRDITERKDSEQKRRQEHELLTTLLDTLADPVYFKDDQNRFILVNKAKAAYANVAPEKMMGKTDFEFLLKEQAQRSVDDENAIMRTGQAILNKIEKVTLHDGSERFMVVTKIPRYNDEDEIIGTMGISKDMTECKRAEEDHGKNIVMLQTLLDTISDSVSFKDTQNRFVLVNKAMAKRFMVQPDAMIGKTDFDFLSAEQAKKTFDEENQILQTGKSIENCMEKVIDKDGSEQWYSVTKVAWYDLGGKIIGTFGLWRNVTESKNVQEIKQQ
ncbi:MAG TPA: PAS domain S-box protein [Candidatus Thermoplasmatota archaeon]|nr:PAS domain S-box protein [Candidatus Thermoplasmatota archaeon]